MRVFFYRASSWVAQPNVCFFFGCFFCFPFDFAPLLVLIGRWGSETPPTTPKPRPVLDCVQFLLRPSILSLSLSLSLAPPTHRLLVRRSGSFTSSYDVERTKQQAKNKKQRQKQKRNAKPTTQPHWAPPPLLPRTQPTKEPSNHLIYFQRNHFSCASACVYVCVCVCVWVCESACPEATRTFQTTTTTTNRHLFLCNLVSYLNRARARVCERVFYWWTTWIRPRPLPLAPPPPHLL